MTQVNARSHNSGASGWIFWLSCAEPGIGLNDSCRSLSIQDILRSYDSVNSTLNPNPNHRGGLGQSIKVLSLGIVWGVQILLQSIISFCMSLATPVPLGFYAFFQPHCFRSSCLCQFVSRNPNGRGVAI